MKTARREWLEGKAELFLKASGLRIGQVVVDFGCGEGMYALPAAKVVMEKGKVYGLDKDKNALDKLKNAARKQGLKNVKPLFVKESHKIPLRSDSVDVVLLYDVLHRGYSPEEKQRKDLLEQICRVLKPGGLLSCYPTHLKKYGMTFQRVLGEVESTCFQLEGNSTRRLLHDNKLVRGCVLSFTRVSKERGTPSRRRKNREVGQ